MSISPIIPFCVHKFKKKPIKVLEIGARYGDSSKMILKHLNVEEYNIVDPYTCYDDYSQDGFNKIMINDENDKIFNTVKKNLNKIHNNVNFYRTFSNDTNTISKLKNNTMDLIFIDGNHTYKYVLEDLENYAPKLKPDGILCGDDFFMRTKKNDILNKNAGGYDEPMVYEAVLEYCRKNNKKYAEFGKHRGYGKLFYIKPEIQRGVLHTQKSNLYSRMAKQWKKKNTN